MDELLNLNDRSSLNHEVMKGICPSLTTSQAERIVKLYGINFDDPFEIVNQGDIVEDLKLEESSLQSILLPPDIGNLQLDTYHPIQIEDLPNIPFPEQIFQMYDKFLKSNLKNKSYIVVDVDDFEFVPETPEITTRRKK